jgi:hypothetical protein
MRTKFKILQGKKLIIFLLVFAFNVSFVLAEANFQVSSFSCSPSEVVQGNIFSCAAQIQNTGTAGTLNSANLYPDANDWLESSVYTQAYGLSIGAGESISLTFTGLKATKSGNNNGFSKIVLDLAERTDFVSTTKVNVINVAVSVGNSVSSAVKGASVVSTVTVVAGGNINVILTFTSNSGGCSIGSQTNPYPSFGMNGGSTSRTWTITQGTSGNCQYTVTAAATGAGGVASKTDSTSSTITCTDCTAAGGDSSSGSGAGGAGGAGATTYQLGELIESQEKEIAKNERIKFNISGAEHKLTLTNVSNEAVVFTIESKKQTFTLNVGNEINVDLNEDNTAEISIRLKSINTITKKANLVFARISGGVPSISEEVKAEAEEKAKAEAGKEKEIFSLNWNSMKPWIYIIAGIIAVIILILLAVSIFRKRKALNLFLG